MKAIARWLLAIALTAATIGWLFMPRQMPFPRRRMDDGAEA